MRRLREHRRAQPQRARWRHGVGQLRHRAGQGAGPRRCVDVARALVAEVEAAGYAVRPGRSARRRQRPTVTSRSSTDETRPLRRSADHLGPAVRAGDRPRDGPTAQFDYWQWLSLTLAAPVVVWGALPFHRAAWRPRHGAATMDTLISIGTLAAFGWSLYACSSATPATPGMTQPSARPRPRRTGPTDLPGGRRRRDCVHPGRPVLRGPRQASPGAALRALLELGCQGRGRPSRRHRATHPDRQLAVGDRFVVRPGEKVATDGVVGGHLRGRRGADDR